MIWWILALIVLAPIVGFALLSLLSKPPKNLGVREGRLADCPKSPNCVCSQASDSDHQMSPIPFDGPPGDAIRRLEAAIQTVPSMKVVSKSETYLHAEDTSRLFRFVDDVEFLVDPAAKVIHCRSASRVGHSDLGVNRARMNKIRDAFESSK